MFVGEVLALTGEWDSYRFLFYTIRGTLGKFSINIDIGYTLPHFRHSDTLIKDYENEVPPISRKSVPSRKVTLFSRLCVSTVMSSAVQYSKLYA